MNVEVNIVAVILAALSSIIIGTFWYSPAGFFKSWSKLARIVPVKKEVQQKKMLQGMAWALIASLLLAYVLAHVSYITNQFFHNSFMMDTVNTAFWMWLGFQGLRTVMSDSFENRPMKLTLINVGNSFITFMVAGLIIGAFKP